MYSGDTEVKVVQLVPDKAVGLVHKIIRLAAAPAWRCATGLDHDACVYSPMADQSRCRLGAGDAALCVRWHP